MILLPLRYTVLFWKKNPDQKISGNVSISYLAGIGNWFEPNTFKIGTPALWQEAPCLSLNFFFSTVYFEFNLFKMTLLLDMIQPWIALLGILMDNSFPPSFFKIKDYAIDAITQTGGRRAILQTHVPVCPCNVRICFRCVPYHDCDRACRWWNLCWWVRKSWAIRNRFQIWYRFK